MNNMRLTLIAGALLSSVLCSATAEVLQDITHSTGKYSSLHGTFVDSESVKELFDESQQSKYLSKEKATWVQYESDSKEVIKAYSITSATDAPARDPVWWKLTASNDGENWQLLHEVHGRPFSQRTETLRYELNNTAAYRYFRLEIKQDGKTPWDDEYLQFADFSLFATTLMPLASFEQSAKIIAPKQNITFSSTSKNAPKIFVWQTPGGEQTGKGEQITVSYSKPGVYGVSLATENAHGSDFVTNKYAVKVLDKSQPWQGFEPPKVTVKFEDTSSSGAKRLMQLMPNLEGDINSVTHELVKMLYKNFAEVPDFEEVEFQLKWMDTLAYRAGSDKKMVIAFSSKYITESLDDQDDAQVRYELMGVLWHELVHGYQLMPKDRSYGSDPGAHAFIEGMADLIRIDAGYHKTRSPSRSENWLGGYTNTGFFLHYAANKYEQDFAYKFNQTAHKLEDWTFEKAFKEVIGQPIQVVWDEYQQTLEN